MLNTNGYTKDLTAELVAENNFIACCETIAKPMYRGNRYWTVRLLAAYDELVRLGIEKPLTVRDMWLSAEKDLARTTTDSTRAVFVANRAAAYRWWLKMKAEKNGNFPSPYHF